MSFQLWKKYRNMNTKGNFGLIDFTCIKIILCFGSVFRSYRPLYHHLLAFCLSGGPGLSLSHPLLGTWLPCWSFTYYSRAMPKPLWAIRFGPSTLDRSLRAMRFGPSTLDCPLWTVPFWPSTLDRPLWTVHFGLIYSLKSDQYSVYDISWMTNSLVLGTESFFCDHTGVVHFDPGQGSMNRKKRTKNFFSNFFPNRG